ncbi:hypothetical protein ACI8B_90027 [Acinetobacter proteolyticus]|uniref:Uncharacterized protein n=1 Tax=Acinetobacter proteolyticus TaxID=1776741 RepID=A0A653KBJ0_9GAMM|nr:hypothetical protein ACI8B_90027 [Acinetobacter proteolyticus]
MINIANIEKEHSSIIKTNCSIYKTNILNLRDISYLLKY